MATIIKRGKKYSVVYNYVNDKGETKQKWESFESERRRRSERRRSSIRRIRERLSRQASRR